MYSIYSRSSDIYATLYYGTCSEGDSESVSQDNQIIAQMYTHYTHIGDT